MKIKGLNGLVMAGGKSARMGSDKALLVYHKQPQYQEVYQMLDVFCEQVFVSARKEQQFDRPVIADDAAFENCGPVAGLLSAFKIKDTAWLLIGVDYPLLETKDIEKLIAERDENAAATVFFNDNNFYEPLLGIYEKAFYPLLKSEFETGNTSLQSILRTCNAGKVHPYRSDLLKSIDHFSDYQKYIRH